MAMKDLDQLVENVDDKEVQFNIATMKDLEDLQEKVKASQAEKWSMLMGK